MNRSISTLGTRLRLALVAAPRCGGRLCDNLLVVLVLAVLSGVGAAQAQNGKPEGKEEPSRYREVIEQQLAELQAELNKLTDEKLKAEVKAEAEKANGFMKEALREEAERKKLEEEAAGASEESKRLRQEEQAATAPAPKIGDDIPPQEFQRLSEQSIKDRAEAERERETLRSRKERFEKRRRKADDDAKTIRERRAALEAEPKAAANEAPQMTLARQVAWRAERFALRRRIDTVDTLKRLGDLLAPLYELRLSAATAKARQVEQREASLRKEMARRRETAAVMRRSELEARVAQVNMQPELVALARQNVALATEIIEVVNSSKETGKDLELRRQELKDLEDVAASTEKKVEAVGLTDAVGQLLRNQKAKLPPVDRYRQNSKLRQAKIGKAQYRLFELDDQRRKLETPEKIEQSVEELHENLFTDLELPGGDGEREHLKVELRQFLNEKKELLALLAQDLDGYFKKLTDLDFEEQKLIAKIESYSEFINERILWVKSTERMRLADGPAAWEAAQWLFGPLAWRELGTALLAGLRDDPLPVVALGLVVFTPWFFAQRRLRRRVSKLGTIAAARTTQSYVPTAETLLHTLLISAFYPCGLAFMGWQLERASIASALPCAVAAGLAAAALVFFPLEVFRQICRRNGLAEAHFGWPQSVLMALRGRLRRLIFFGLPLVYVAATLNAQDNASFDGSLGRLAFIAVMLLVAGAVAIALRPSGAVFRHVGVHQVDGWLYRLRNAIYAVALAGPLAEALLAGIGFYYTAWQLAECLHATIHLGLGLIVASALIERWLLVNRRHMAIEQRKQSLKVQTSAPAEPAAAEMSGVVMDAPPEMDLAAVSEQTRRLLNVMLVMAGLLGLWWVWSQVLPALNILDRVTLWQTSLGELVEAVSLADLALAAIFFTVTIIAAKNVPGLLQITVLQRLPIDAGMRYAIDNVSRYLIVIVGTAISFSLIGIGWGKIQWLVAAISVGLGFGLQEIFANFVSGLIILFEQPVRVGDVVTIEGSTGVVSKIRIRATTITTWDRQELIVPNKEFITGRLLNWTLSDNVNRVLVNVGVAYGSDTQQVTDILMRIASNHPHVLRDPPPAVALDSFGDSALNFSLRAYLGDLEERSNVIHELHSAIHEEFNRAGIEIAFPQRDLRIRAMPSGMVMPTASGHAKAA
jgi:potassium efflux system protein